MRVRVELGTKFEQHVERQVLDFLQTVVMVDDEAFRRAPRTVDAREDDWNDDGVAPAFGSALKLISPAESPTGDELDVQEVSVCFANQGLSCAILSPQTSQENTEFKPAFVKTAKRADALILDWNLNGDNGKTIEKLIQAVLNDDAKSPRRRLRLITIYTGEPDLPQIAERVAGATEQSLSDDALHWDAGEKVAFSRGPVRVSVFAKEHVSNLPKALGYRRKEVSELPQIIVKEFSRHSMGLVTSASLAALSGIRNDAHRLIAALGPQLDAALLGQRISLPHPEDVERQVESLIGSELLAIVQDHEVGSHVGMARIKDWLRHHHHLTPRGASSFEEVTAKLRLQILAEGFSDEVVAVLKQSGVSGEKIKKVRREGTTFFSSTEKEKLASDRLFATRMSLRSRYSKPLPILQLGSIVEQDGGYAVCVQPLCDSVRILGARAFPLLPLEVAQEGDMKAGDGLLTVADERSDEKFVRLRVNAKPAGMRMEVFKASTAGVVRARRYHGVSRFATGSGKTWRWVGDLKPDHAQRVIERLSAEFSRVGLDEAEVLRLGL